MRCIIFGGLGYIGSHLAVRLAELGYGVTVYDSSIPENFVRSKLPEVENIIISSVEDIDKVKASIVDVDIIFWLVSGTNPASSNQDPVNDINSNLIPFVSILKSLSQFYVKKFIFASSGGAVYGNPIFLPVHEDHPKNPVCSYGITKVAMEDYLYMYNKIYNFDYFVLRIANPYGKGLFGYNNYGPGLIGAFLNNYFNSNSIEIWGDGSIVRDYIHINDVVSSFLSVANYRGDERIFNIGTQIGSSINDIISLIESFTNSALSKVYYPSRSFDVYANILDIKRAKEELLWEPRISLQDGIGKMLNC